MHEMKQHQDELTREARKQAMIALTMIGAITIAIMFLCISLAGCNTPGLGDLDEIPVWDSIPTNIVLPPLYEPEPDPEPLADDIDPATIRWHDADVGSWPITTDLSVQIGRRNITYRHEKAAEWPAKAISDTAGSKSLYGNPWIVVRDSRGQWHASTWEWFRAGQDTKPHSKIEPGHLKSGGPFREFRLVDGETYGFLVSTLARGPSRTVDERSRIVLARWGQ